MRRILVPLILALLILIDLAPGAGRGVPLLRGGASTGGTWPSPSPSAAPRTVGLLLDECAATHCGGVARWPALRSVVVLCSVQHGRPGWVSADVFREAVQAGADAWSHAHARIGLRYTGDCDGTARWSFVDGVNSIGWDDERRVLGTAFLGATFPVIDAFSALSGQRAFQEVDIILRPNRVVPSRCLQAVITHELGHVLGLGHSDDPRQVMNRIVVPIAPSLCRVDPAPDELAVLRDLYGPHEPPTLSGPAVVRAQPGAEVKIEYTGVGAEGERVTFAWEQVFGPRTDWRADSAVLHVVAPAAPTDLVFLLTSRDQYGHVQYAAVRVLVYDPDEAGR